MGTNVTITLKYGTEWANQDWFSLIMTPIGNIVGDLKWLIIGMVIFSMLWTKGEHTAMLSIVGVVYTILVISAIPQESQVYALILTAISIGILVYRSFYRVNEG